MKMEISDAMRRLLTAAKMLYANSVGCVTNHYPADYMQMGLPGWLVDCEKDILAAEATLAAREAEAGAMKLKPLEWFTPEGLHSTFHAKSIIGNYSIWEIGGCGYFVSPGAHGGTAAVGGLDGAKAAAQAHLEAAVRSVLVSPAPHVAEGPAPTLRVHSDEDVWYDATNAVCQVMQERNMCKCEDGKCVAASIDFPAPHPKGGDGNA
jgi:hypothetical protein